MQFDLVVAGHFAVIIQSSQLTATVYARHKDIPSVIGRPAIGRLFAELSSITAGETYCALVVDID